MPLHCAADVDEIVGDHTEPDPAVHADEAFVRIEIEDDLLGRPRVRLNKQVDQQIPDRHRIVADLVIARRLQLAQLQPIERRLAGNRRAVVAPGFQLARQHRHHRIVAQLVVVVEILIAERDRENTRWPTNVATACSIRSARGSS